MCIQIQILYNIIILLHNKYRYTFFLVKLCIKYNSVILPVVEINMLYIFLFKVKNSLRIYTLIFCSTFC